MDKSNADKVLENILKYILKGKSEGRAIAVWSSENDYLENSEVGECYCLALPWQKALTTETLNEFNHGLQNFLLEDEHAYLVYGKAYGGWEQDTIIMHKSRIAKKIWNSEKILE